MFVNAKDISPNYAAFILPKGRTFLNHKLQSVKYAAVMERRAACVARKVKNSKLNHGRNRRKGFPRIKPIKGF